MSEKDKKILLTDHEKRDEFISTLAELISDRVESDLTIIITWNPDLGNECCSDGFSPEENPEKLELFLVLLMTVAQSAIDACGVDDKIWLKRKGEMIDFAQLLKDLDKAFRFKLH